MRRRRGPDGSGACFRRNDGTWQAAASMGRGPDGKRFRITTYGSSSAIAQKRLNERKAELAARPLATMTDDGAQTVASWSAEYLRYVELSQGLRFTTVAYYRSKLELHVLPALGIIRLSALTGTTSTA